MSDKYLWRCDTCAARSRRGWDRPEPACQGADRHLARHPGHIAVISTPVMYFDE